jgi:hypothetical protein
MCYSVACFARLVDGRGVNSSAVRDEFVRNGFVVEPRLLSTMDLSPGIAALPQVFPTASDFHDNVDPGRNRQYRSEFGGIHNFPFVAVELSLLAVHERLVDLAAALLGSDDLRAYSIEAWAKYTDAASYNQSLHRDYLNHSLLVPASRQPPVQVEMFLYLSDVTPALGPPAYVPLRYTNDLPALPNWYPPEAGQRDPEHPGWVSSDGHVELYEREVTAAAPAGTVVAYRSETLHRATELRQSRGARYTIHLSLRRRDADWITRRGWTDRANTDAWLAFVTAASPRQLQLFGFPPPGHAYWDDATLTEIARRYPGFDPTPWRSHPH